MEIIFHSHANNTHVGHLASFWKRGFLELGSGLLECGCWYWGYKGRRQRGRAVSALDLQSEDPGFNTRPNCWLDLFKSSIKVVNIQLICLYQVGIVSLVTFISQFQVVPSLCFKTKVKCAKSLIWFSSKWNSFSQMGSYTRPRVFKVRAFRVRKWSIWSISFSYLLGLTSLGAVNTAGG